MKSSARSICVFCASSGSCNNCDSETLALSMPRFDVEQCGVVFVQNARDADILFVIGAIIKKAAPQIKRTYEEMQKPSFVVAVGSCACSGVLFKAGNNTLLGVDKIIPVDVYVPGCPPRPEAIILGIAKAVEKCP